MMISREMIGGCRWQAPSPRARTKVKAVSLRLNLRVEFSQAEGEW
jgi:hypothetical protein